MIKLTMVILMSLLSSCMSIDKILNESTDKDHILDTKTKDISASELPLALEIEKRLKATLATKGPVAAGLAAPQIGINRSVFIYSFDRNPEHLALVINPTFEPIGTQTVDGWEACFSGMKETGERKVAKMRRYEKIRVSYMDHEGKQVSRELNGFAAKVFQHEFDHLQGYLNFKHPKALEVRTFEDEQSFEAFMTSIRAEDKKRYNKS